jgi:hypothetical protein
LALGVVERSDCFCMIKPAALQFISTEMVDEVYRFEPQIQDVCGKVFLGRRSLDWRSHLQI